MKLTFLGAAQEVTGSMHLLQTGRGNVLVDCGFFQGRREESNRRNRSLERGALEADVTIVTHAHLDHAGSLPTLIKSGFKGSVFMTPATRDLCAFMLRDAARIQQSDAAYLNRKYAEDPKFKPVTPTYDEEDVIRALGHFVGVPYHRRFQVLPSVYATFLDAGHILGSAQLVLEVETEGAVRRFVFSGDLGRPGLPILRDPEMPQVTADYVVMESTYGNRDHGDIRHMHDELERVVTETVARGGKVIVPAFALGRTQELLYALSALRSEGRLLDIPVFVDSPLAIRVTDVFKLHPECYDAETRGFLEKKGRLFDFEGLNYSATREESMQLNDLKGPAVIISASGMCEGGRILHHLRNHIEDARNTILIVGFQAEHTLGRRIAERRPRVRIWGVERELRAHVEVQDAFSAHAGRTELLAYARHTGRQARRIFLVHGEPAAQTALSTTLAAEAIPVTVPKRLETVVLD